MMTASKNNTGIRVQNHGWKRAAIWTVITVFALFFAGCLTLFWAMIWPVNVFNPNTTGGATELASLLAQPSKEQISFFA